MTSTVISGDRSPGEPAQEHGGRLSTTGGGSAGGSVGVAAPDDVGAFVPGSATLGWAVGWALGSTLGAAVAGGAVAFGTQIFRLWQVPYFTPQ